MMPNTTYEIRNLYRQQSPYSARPIEPDSPALLHWPEKSYLDRFRPDADLLQTVLTPLTERLTANVADQVFGNQKRLEYLDLKHAANLFYERCNLHNQQIQEIDQRHLEIQEKKFGVEINHLPDRAKRLSNLESQLLQLEQARRDEDLAFWKDTVELRQKLFEQAAAYQATRHRYAVFSHMEGANGK